MTVMDITIQSSFLPHDDPDAALAFYRDVLGFEVRLDVGYGGMRWITVGPPEQPGTSIVLHPPFADPGITEDERRTIAEMMAKGTYATIVLATDDIDGTFERWRPAVPKSCRSRSTSRTGFATARSAIPRATTSASTRRTEPSGDGNSGLGDCQPDHPTGSIRPTTSGVTTMTESSTQGIKTVLHPVSDLAAAKAVYAALLGVPPQTDESYYVGFEAEGQHIGLVPGGGPQGMTSPVAYWHVPDIEAKLAEVTAAGATVKEPAHDVGGGRLVATVTDPDGNVLGLLQDR